MLWSEADLRTMMLTRARFTATINIQTSQAPQPAVCPQGFLLLWQKLSELPPL